MVLEFSEIGANDFTSTLRRVFLVFSGTNPTSSPALAYSRKVALVSTAASDGSGTWNSATACFDLMKNAYWHVLSLTISSSEQEELVGMQFDLVPAGKRTETALQPLP